MIIVCCISNIIIIIRILMHSGILYFYIKKVKPPDSGGFYNINKLYFLNFLIIPSPKTDFIAFLARSDLSRTVIDS